MVRSANADVFHLNNKITHQEYSTANAVVMISYIICTLSATNEQ
jgi:hypothetical protein